MAADMVPKEQEKECTLTVIFKNEFDLYVIEEKVNNEGNFNFPDPEFPGYVFLGWKLEGFDNYVTKEDIYDMQADGECKLILVADWERLYTVVFKDYI